MKLGLIGRKLGMTQIFDDERRAIPVTVVQAEPNVILQVKTEEHDGYHALKIGAEALRSTPRRARKPIVGQAKAADCAPKRFMREIRLDQAAADEHAVGNELTVEIFTAGEKVDAVGTSKGRGFAGVMKRHGFKGALGSHGTHEFVRHGGAIGMNMTPGHVIKVMKMPGQMGNKRVTTQNLTVAEVRPDENLILIKGAVPGPKGSHVFIRHAVKS